LYSGYFIGLFSKNWVQSYDFLMSFNFIINDLIMALKHYSEQIVQKLGKNSLNTRFWSIPIKEFIP